MDGKAHRFLKKLTKKLTNRSSKPSPTPILSKHEPPAERVHLYDLDEFDAIYESILKDADMQGMVCCCMGETIRIIRIGHSYKDLIRISNPKKPFPFLALPADIQTMILDYIVNPYPGKKWTAYVTQNRGGLQFMPNNRTMRCAKYFDEPVIWRNNNHPSTRSLLLTSRVMHDLTIKTLQRSFSGKLCPQGHKFAGLTGPQIPDEFFERLRPDQTFVMRNSWIFHRVIHISVDRRWSDWILAADIMPQLKSVTLRHHLWTNIHVQMTPVSERDREKMFWAGEIEVFVIRNRSPHTIEELWSEYRLRLLTGCSESTLGRKDLEVYVSCTEVVAAWLLRDVYDSSQSNKEYELCIWPEMNMGKIRS